MARNFSVPDWETNLVATNISKDLFEAVSIKEFQSKQTDKFAPKSGKELKRKSKKSKLVSKLKNQLKHETSKSNLRKDIKYKQEQTIPKSKEKLKLNNENQKKGTCSSISVTIQKKSLKKKIDTKLRQKFKMTMQNNVSSNSKRVQSTSSLRERMMDKLKGARFRFLNEHLYKNKGSDTLKYFKQNPNDYKAYHEGYRHQVMRWPINPVDVIIQEITKLPCDKIVADFGCGEGKLAKSIPHQVYSFDLVAVNEHITACDMAHVPLRNNSTDIVVFCLSLMGTNLKDYIKEACRVLKINGILKIAEVESRFGNVDSFIKNIESFGFVKTKKNLSHDLFCFMDFQKKDNIKDKKKLPDLELSACLYKKR